MGQQLRGTPATLAVLEALLELGEPHGLQVCEHTGLASGTVYPILNRLEGHALAVSHWESDGDRQRPKRRFWHLTDQGRQFAHVSLSKGNPVARRPEPEDIPEDIYSYTTTQGVTYYLHSKVVVLRGGKSQKIYFFAKDARPNDAVSELPEGYVVVENPRNHILILKKDRGERSNPSPAT
ncbi:PadR family transcriptional regulator [Streptomyces sp. NPDC056464]|uniref:PadR family transcriptional regulator n=1 Tax=Streptomyces sp. NPDC056464 TaxID=3345828 RepID=UPI0036C1BFF2